VSSRRDKRSLFDIVLRSPFFVVLSITYCHCAVRQHTLSGHFENVASREITGIPSVSLPGLIDWSLQNIFSAAGPYIRYVKRSAELVRSRFARNDEMLNLVSKSWHYWHVLRKANFWWAKVKKVAFLGHNFRFSLCGTRSATCTQRAGSRVCTQPCGDLIRTPADFQVWRSSRTGVRNYARPAYCYGQRFASLVENFRRVSQLRQSV